MHQKMSTNKTTILIYLFGMLLTGYAAEDKQCEVLGVHVTTKETNTSFMYAITYKDPSCTNKGELKGTLRRCNTTIDYRDLPGEGEVNNCPEGKWMVTVAGNVSSSCFPCWGFDLNLSITPFFTYDQLEIVLRPIHPAVKSWNLTIFKTTVEADYKSCEHHHGLKHIRALFQDTQLKANITLSQITLKHSFDPHACYCFVLNPVSHLSLNPPVMLVTTPTCRPNAPSRENGASRLDYGPKSRWEKTGWGVLAGVMLCFVVMTFVALRSPVFLGKILRLKRLKIKENASERIPLPCDSRVLLLYATDIADSQDLKRLKKDLQASFTVYDLFDRPNLNQLADQSGWTEQVLLPTSGVKMVLVESVGLHEKIASLFDSDKESSMDAMLAKKSVQEKTAENLLTFVLRTIIASLRNDYSSVFVVRFTDEVKNAVFFLVQMRRYKIPDHFLELSKDMKEAKRMTAC